MGRRPQQAFLLRKYVQMAKKKKKKHRKRSSTSLITRAIQIQTTMRYHLTLVRRAIIKKSTNNISWRGCGEKGTLLPHGWECKLIQAVIGNGIEIL